MLLPWLRYLQIPSKMLFLSRFSPTQQHNETGGNMAKSERLRKVSSLSRAETKRQKKRVRAGQRQQSKKSILREMR
jgi:hypothetical protein